MEPVPHEPHPRTTRPSGRPGLRLLVGLVSGVTLLVAVLASAGAFGRPDVAPVSTADVITVPPVDTAADAPDPAGDQAVGDTGETGSKTATGGKHETAARPDSGPSQRSRPAVKHYGRHADLLPLPAHSGKGKRIVYSLGHQQVWLVDADNQVRRTYRVSGSKFHQVKVKRYQVTGRYRHTISYLGDATMEFMVTFTHGKNAVIGFHAIPIFRANHRPEQTPAQLGRRLSDGCVRQYRADAKALWQFAPVGTPVDVVG